jgi:hypothetical protein
LVLPFLCIYLVFDNQIKSGGFDHDVEPPIGQLHFASRNRVDEVRSDPDLQHLCEDLVRGLMAGAYNVSERTRQIVDNRHAMPDAFASLVSDLKTELRAAMGPRFDQQARDDCEAVTAAVRGTNEKPAPAEFPHRALSSMDNTGFKRELEKIGIDPAVARLDGLLRPPHGAALGVVAAPATPSGVAPLPRLSRRLDRLYFSRAGDSGPER